MSMARFGVPWRRGSQRDCAALGRILAQRGFRQAEPAEGSSSVADLFRPGRRCGIYVLHFTTGELYVGQSVNVVRRYAEHLKVHQDVAALSFKEFPREQLDDVEQSLIELLERDGESLRNVRPRAVIDGGSASGLLVWRTEYVPQARLMTRTCNLVRIAYYPALESWRLYDLIQHLSVGLITARRGDTDYFTKVGHQFSEVSQLKDKNPEFLGCFPKRLRPL